MPEDLDYHPEPNGDRRGFLKGAGAIVLGGVAVLGPLAAGLRVFLGRRSASAAGNWVRVTNLSALPENGQPRRFSVRADRVDAWNRTPDTPIGAVYLRRVAAQQVEALNVVCPHAGCLVDYAPSTRSFLCPCHNSTFALDGRVNDPGSPSPRGLDTLETEIRNQGEVWVRFQNFRTGRADKAPAA